MNRILFFALLVFASQKAYAYEDPIHQISLGYGYPNLPKMLFNNINYFSDNPNFKSSSLGPLHAKYEYRINSVIGVGLSMNYSNFKMQYTVNQLDTNLAIIVPNRISASYWNLATNVRVNFHFIDPDDNDKLDIYCGIGIGYRTGRFKFTADLEDYKPKITYPNLIFLGLESTVGVRYHFTDYLGAYLELGAAKSIVQAGITARLGYYP